MVSTYLIFSNKWPDGLNFEQKVGQCQEKVTLKLPSKFLLEKEHFYC